MAAVIEEFSHGGENLTNDMKQAWLTMLGLALFATFAATLIVYVLRTV